MNTARLVLKKQNSGTSGTTIFIVLLRRRVGRVAQSVQRLPTGWTVRGSNPGGARFSATVQTGPEAHPASCTMSTGSFPGVRCCRGVTLPLTPFQCRGLKQSRDTPLLSLRAFVACGRVKTSTKEEEQWYIRHSYFYWRHVSTYIQVIFKPSFTDKSIKCYTCWDSIMLT